ncbi:unnamed protein product [Gongylonema pulchrum]|uniref:Chromo domain-containing protein n=1 Tax=Gongylonema pulchrum TaxID=637853 RepID=A0A183DQ07_9BILA|nr:unnamed protein product [Gongylonema pulchrum]
MKNAKQRVDEGQEYVVEKILNKRVRNGVTEYFLSWKGFPASENTWEPEENLDCPDLIRVCHYFTVFFFFKFFCSHKNKEAFEEAARAKKQEEETAMCSGLEQGLDPEEILGATSVGGQLTFLIKWKGSERADMVPAAVANKKWPQLVIGFYEARIQWKESTP